MTSVGYDRVNFHRQDSKTKTAKGIFNTLLTSCPVYMEGGVGRGGAGGGSTAGSTGFSEWRDAVAVNRALCITDFVFAIFPFSLLLLFK